MDAGSPPPWSELVAGARCGLTALTSLSASICLVPAPGAEPVDRSVRFRGPGSWLIEDRDGFLLLRRPGLTVHRTEAGDVVRDPVRSWYPTNEIFGLGWGHPKVLAGTAPDGTCPVLEDEVGSRRAWKVRLRSDGSKTSAMQVWFDTRTGLLLKWEAADGSSATAVCFDPDAELGDDTFPRRPDEERLPLSSAALSRAGMRLHRAVGDRLPRVMPGLVGEVTWSIPFHDPETGSLLLVAHDEARGELVVRRRAASDPFPVSRTVLGDGPVRKDFAVAGWSITVTGDSPSVALPDLPDLEFLIALGARRARRAPSP